MMASVATGQPTQRRGFASFFPILGRLLKYDRCWLRPDIIAGITVVALLVPGGMAYAELGGMLPEWSTAIDEAAKSCSTGDD
jgi:uncharacterized membrane protein YjjB (DUF3815 family)